MKYFIVIILFSVIGCRHTDKTKTEHSFYYWKTSFGADSNATVFIDKEAIDHFYIHYFDVEWDNNTYLPVPVAEIGNLKNATPFLQSHFTPVIFITNECFTRMSNDWCDSLAYKIRNKIIYITNRLEEVNHGTNNKITEIQIDCDWTAGNKEKYFQFLKTFKQLYPDKIVSATIRLYPYKYFEKTGVPPVDKGLLMCYNLTNIKDTGNENSIFTLNDLERYLEAKKYPLVLDVALPVFGWYAWFRNGEYKGIIYPDNSDSMLLNKSFFNQTGNKIILLADTVINNNYLREGDILRPEFPAKNELDEAAAILKRKLPGTNRISLFYWDKFLIKNNEDIIHKIYAAY